MADGPSDDQPITGTVMGWSSLELEQMADGPSDDQPITVPVRFRFFVDAKNVGEVFGNTRFLRNDDDRHVVWRHPRLYLNPPLSP